ncbi:MAG: hypothetical protein DWI27_01635 [Planctomycetota bacterium]|jgi:hypothetical protein|nr:MAG: hypothetical protein DWI27_01635 [Planctomycetota bacterium]
MKSNQMFRTGTVLRLALGPLATAVLIVASSAGFSRQAAAANPAGTFASTSLTGAIGAPGWLQHGPCPETLLPDRVQPVEIRGPEGLLMAIETAEGWSMLRPGPLRMGLVVGQPYRLRIGGIPGRDGEELFPSVRVLAKLAAPPGMAWRFPVEIVIDEDDLESAATGGHVRRIVYASCESEQPDPVPAGWFDVKPGDDALEVARTLGDPVAEVVIGNRQPTPETLP